MYVCIYVFIYIYIYIYIYRLYDGTPQHLYVIVLVQITIRASLATVLCLNKAVWCEKRI